MLRICWIRTISEIHDYMLYKLSPMQKHYETNLNMSEKWSRSSQCHNLNKFDSTCTWEQNAANQVWRSLAFWFRRRRLLKVFAKYGLGSYLGQVTRDIWTNFHPNIPWRLNMKFGFKRPSVFFFLGKDVESEWPWPLIFLKIHKII